MTPETITIDDVELAVSAGQPFTFDGKHAGKTLAGIDLDFSVDGQDQIEAVEGLLKSEKVQVVDPFVNRSYRGTLRSVSKSYTEGYSERHYVAQVKEFDLPPQFETLEVDGRPYPVLGYYETDPEEDIIGRHALLRLSCNDFEELEKAIQPGSIRIRRVGIDAEAIVARYGGGMFWSKHEEDDQAYYKHIVRFFPPDYSPGKPDLASGIKQEALVRLVVGLWVRFEELVNHLADKKLLAKEHQEALLAESCREPANESRIDLLYQELYRVADAEEVFER